MNFSGDCCFVTVAGVSRMFTLRTCIAGHATTAGERSGGLTSLVGESACLGPLVNCVDAVVRWSAFRSQSLAGSRGQSWSNCQHSDCEASMDLLEVVRIAVDSSRVCGSLLWWCIGCCDCEIVFVVWRCESV